MDSGCSKHMTGSKNQFLSLKDLKRGNVSFGNGKKREIIGVGKDTNWVNAMQDELNQFERSQQKYAKELIKKFKMKESKEIDIPIATTKLDIDEHGSSVDQKLYRGMIGSLLYLTASRPDIVFSVGLSARFQLVDFGIEVGCIPIFYDNISAISMTKNHVHHKRTKHIDVRHHFLRDNFEKGLISIEFCATDKQIADIFTKVLSRENFERNMLELGMIKIT
ncbi:uncharacterized protein [Nicotiana sylvestris]|uniref:uncharacterized protein n=1 Tax=Nicotiana sylvestris TaxID=4096 RepID=UPI00388CA308